MSRRQRGAGDPHGVAGFNAMGALSTRNDDPAAREPPIRRRTRRIRAGEGGAALILESASMRPGAARRSWPKLRGYATTDDANHIVQPAPGGEGRRGR